LYFLAAGLGAVFGLACVALLWVFSFRDPLPPVTVRDFEAAQQRWRENGPESYDMEVEVLGPQPAVYRVEVRGGEPSAAFRNGRPLTQRRTWATWSVPGMFDTQASDFRHVARIEAGTADETTPRLSLYGIYHPQYGYPERYRRIMLGQGQEESMAHRIGQGRTGGGSSAMEVSWRVLEFTVQGERGAAAPR
jgi:hypothetical protein